jgi:metal-responsive CopG/Arc/MetJ family transcriptional regulator
MARIIVCMSKIKPTVAPELPNMKRHNVFMPQSFLDGLSKLAAEKGGTSSDHLRKAVSSYLKRHKLHV